MERIRKSHNKRWKRYWNRDRRHATGLGNPQVTFLKMNSTATERLKTSCFQGTEHVTESPVPVPSSTIFPIAIMWLSVLFISRVSVFTVKVVQPFLFVCRKRDMNREKEHGVEEDKLSHRCWTIQKKCFQILVK